MKKALSFVVCGMLVMSMTVSSYAMETQKTGCRNDEVREIQEMLISTGYLAEGEADGVFGPKTEAAVLAFQQDNSLDATGMVGEATFNALKAFGAEEEAEAALEEAAEKAGAAVEEAAEEVEAAAEEVVEEVEAAAEEAAEEVAAAVEEAAEEVEAAAEEETAGEAEGAAEEETVDEAEAAAEEEAAEEVEAAEEAETAPEEAAADEATDEAAADEAETEDVQTEEAPAEELDYAVTFPSWNPDSESLAELVDFVTASTDESGDDYIEPADRIATFDMDGTVLCEKAPVYFDYCMTLYRVLDDPTYEATAEERDSMQIVRDHAYSEGKTFDDVEIPKNTLVASAFEGMTPEEFRAYVVSFADTVDAVGFEGMTYGESFYKPMIEVIDYLRANDFDVWMVSACEREVVRALMDRYDIPLDHCIATDVPYVASGKGEDEAADEYNIGQEETMLLGAPLDEVECGKSGKPAAIAREIGKRPVLAFGNSSGDFSMLNYAEGNTEHKGMGFFVVCDDTVREYGSDEKAADFYETAAKEDWTAISMANDWSTIYGEGVVKTELPGAAETAEAADTAETAEAAEAAEAAETAEAAEAAEAAEVVEAAETVEAAEAAEAADAAEADETAEAADAAEADEAAEVAEPAEADDAAEVAEPAEKTETAEPAETTGTEIPEINEEELANAVEGIITALSEIFSNAA